MQCVHAGQDIFLQFFLQENTIVLFQQGLNGFHFRHVQQSFSPAVAGKMDHQYRTGHLGMMLPEPVGKVACNKEHIVYFIITHMITDQGSAMPL